MSPLNAVHNGWDHLTTGIIRVIRGTLAGFIGGVFAAWVMNQYQIMEQRNEKPGWTGWSDPPTPPDVSTEPFVDGASVAVAEQISLKVLERELSSNEKRVAGPVVQYGSSAIAGAVYGGFAELMPSITRGFGIPYATMLWLGGDQLILPALNLTPQSIETSPRNHASTVARRFIFGISLDFSRRILRRII